MEEIAKLQMDLHELKSKIEGFVESTSPLYLQETMYWSNSDLTPGYSSVPNSTKAKFYLKQGKENGTLDQVHSYHDPLAFTVNAASYKNGIVSSKKWSCKFRAWDLTRLSFLTREGSSQQTQNYTEYGVWTEDGKSSKTNRFQEKIMDQVASLE